MAPFDFIVITHEINRFSVNEILNVYKMFEISKIV